MKQEAYGDETLDVGSSCSSSGGGGGNRRGQDDLGNNRVLEYFAPLTSGTFASRVFGQANFTETGPNQNGLNAAGLYGAWMVAVDVFGDPYVADSSNNRVLQYQPPLASGMAASRVFGQPGFN